MSMSSSDSPETKYQLGQYVVIWTRRAGILFWGPIRAIYLFSRRYLVGVYGDEMPGEVFDEEDILLTIDQGEL